jgi:FkbM family methyltransferase
MVLLGRLIYSYGLIRGLLLFLRLRSSNGKISIPNIQYPVYFRKNTSDLAVMHGVLFANSYGIKLRFQPEVIIDAGANVGYASIAFANQYPGAKIYAIEPDEGNFAMLQKNTRFYPNIHCIQAALWYKKCRIQIKNSGASEWAFIVEELPATSTEGIPSITLNDLMLNERIDTIGILKIDIEGSEKEVFENGFERWLPNTRCVMVEVHDGLKKGTSKAVFKAISQYDFSFKRSGENLVFVNDKL